MDDDERHPARFEQFNCPEYHDLVGRAGRFAANYLAERREQLRTEYGATTDGERDHGP